MALIAARDVRRVYRTGNVDVRALDGVSLNIESGQLTTIVGPSGSGKSTLLNILGGMDQPTSGSVVCDGVEIENLSEAGLTKYRRERVGFVFQFYNLIPTLTAAENVGIACRGIKGAIEPSEILNAKPMRRILPPVNGVADLLKFDEDCSQRLAPLVAQDVWDVLQDEPPWPLLFENVQDLEEQLPLEGVPEAELLASLGKRLAREACR